MDLHSRMQRLGGTIEEPSAAAIEGDLARGRKAVRRRRAARVATGSAVGVAAIATAFALTVTGPAGTPPATVPAPALAEASASGVQLVAYSGEQPEGFTIDKVPQGYTVQTQNEHALVLAPEQLPSVRLSDVPDSVLDNPQAFIYKIAVYLAGPEAVPGDSEKISVGGKNALFHLDAPRTSEGEREPGARYFITVAPSVHMVVQFWPDMKLTEVQMTEIAGGIDVAPETVAAYVAERGY
ncbi:hypothetical protein [Catenuloplanes indicus]|uniref:Uncharacterized protein n=1 Tax=Catenuloplanes indicus TaxID=137267 RepID=A0AAE3VZ90_9ACTN|nr:hypothetical protein [Catenuloplanes indicus]MDQ0366576.1 hypothetical protein [Catenuloplanes indicus]